jgi:hypothetical protein
MRSKKFAFSQHAIRIAIGEVSNSRNGKNSRDARIIREPATAGEGKDPQGQHQQQGQ